MAAAFSKRQPSIPLISSSVGLLPPSASPMPIFWRSTRWRSPPLALLARPFTSKSETTLPRKLPLASRSPCRTTHTFLPSSPQQTRAPTSRPAPTATRSPWPTPRSSPRLSLSPPAPLRLPQESNKGPCSFLFGDSCLYFVTSLLLSFLHVWKAAPGRNRN